MKYSQKMLCRAPFAEQSPMIGDQSGVYILSDVKQYELYGGHWILILKVQKMSNSKIFNLIFIKKILNNFISTPKQVSFRISAEISTHDWWSTGSGAQTRGDSLPRYYLRDDSRNSRSPRTPGHNEIILINSGVWACVEELGCNRSKHCSGYWRG